VKKPHLNYNFSYEDLFSPFALQELHNLFFQRMEALCPTLFEQHALYMAHLLPATAESVYLIDASIFLEDFLKHLFSLNDTQYIGLEQAQHIRSILYFRREFWQKRLRGKHFPDWSLGDEALWAELLRNKWGQLEVYDEYHFAQLALDILSAARAAPKDIAAQEELALAERFHHQRAQKQPLAYSYRSPGGHDPAMPTGVVEDGHLVVSHELALKNYTRPQFYPEHMEHDALAIHWEADYCIRCHPRQKDSCRRGLKIPITEPKKSGCPLKQHISECHEAYIRGHVLAALCLIMIENPMVAGTGERICNDCMQACIFQKQQPVDVPKIETHILKQVLQQAWGFELYGLLTRFHPLRRKRPYPLPYSGKNVLVVGAGPAGYTLAHYLCQEGCGVLLIDGNKLEYPPEQWIGGSGRFHEAVENIETNDFLWGSPEQRFSTGIGGVAEYGITARWQKHFLNIIAVTLLRQRTFSMCGGIRFGSQIQLKDCKRLKLEHVALCTGAGKPKLVSMGDNFPKGMRFASDFLMLLHHSTPHHNDSLSALDIEFPAVVIGAGLTAVDTATEVLAYYIQRLKRLALVVAERGLDAYRAALSVAERELFERLWEHALLWERHVREPEVFSFTAWLKATGGVSILYRRRLVDSPAFRQNPEELSAAFAQGVRFIPEVTPIRCALDECGHLDGIWLETREKQRFCMPARSAFMAAGTLPQFIEDDEDIARCLRTEGGEFFWPHSTDDGGAVVRADWGGAFLSSETPYGRVSFFGDAHPCYQGSVVKAMASAKEGYSAVMAELAKLPAKPREAVSAESWHGLVDYWRHMLQARIVETRQLAESIIELVIHAPLAAEKFRPGQFYRLQNLKKGMLSKEKAIKPLALTGAWTDAEKGELGLIVLQMGASSRALSELRSGDAILLMGPTGMPTEIPKQKKVVLCGGGLGNAVLFSIGAAMRAEGCRVVYFAAYRHPRWVFRQADLEAAADSIVWCFEEYPDDVVFQHREQDRVFQGNILEALKRWASGNEVLERLPFLLGEATSIMAIGSAGMMAAIGQLQQDQTYGGYFHPECRVIVSVNAPMQCMLKGICGECLQRKVDPKTQQESYIFTCAEQDQTADEVDFNFLKNRLSEVHLNLR
jgi:NADPH-dependent glutamate synthase beta subunit-like oxidoreductase/NAD(P)H-flavin reductase